MRLAAAVLRCDGWEEALGDLADLTALYDGALGRWEARGTAPLAVAVLEPTLLLVRNIALPRGNKQRVLAHAQGGLLGLVLACAGHPNVRVAAAAWAALWSLLYRSERAKALLRREGPKLDLAVANLDAIEAAAARHERLGGVVAEAANIRAARKACEMVAAGLGLGAPAH